MLAIRSLRPVDTLEYIRIVGMDSGAFLESIWFSVPSYQLSEGIIGSDRRNIQGKSIGRLGLLYVLEVQMIQPKNWRF